MLYRRGVLFTWLAIVAASAWWTTRHGVVTTDLTAFLPVASGRLERLLVEQLRAGVASRTMLVAIEGGAPSELARFSRELARAIAPDRRFDYVMNGGAEFTRGARELGLKHRYLLSPTVSVERFSEQSLARALRGNLERREAGRVRDGQAGNVHRVERECRHVDGRAMKVVDGGRI